MKVTTQNKMNMQMVVKYGIRGSDICKQWKQSVIGLGFISHWVRVQSKYRAEPLIYLKQNIHIFNEISYTYLYVMLPNIALSNSVNLSANLPTLTA